jgi:hypothetical protein
MRQARLAISIFSVWTVLLLPVQQADAQSASANANSSTNAAANASGKSVNAQGQAQASANAQANMDAAAKLAAEKKAAAEARAQAAAKAAAEKAAEKKADAQAKAEAQASAAAQKKAEAQAKAEAAAQANITMAKPSWQAVMDKLFGTPDNGLVDGKSAFQFRAEDVALTAEQGASFFSSSATSSADLASLIEAATALHGQVRMDGTIDGKPFELKLAGRELKIEGLTLTAAQREALSAELRGISALRETKINALVDGRASVIHIAGGQERLQLLGRERSESNGGAGERKVDVGSRADASGKVEIDRGAKIESSGRVENSGRIESGRIENSGRVENSGRIEVPEKPVRSILGGK